VQKGLVAKEGGSVTCTINRQFKTIYSEITLKDWYELKGQFGFKIYNTTEVTVPFPKGSARSITLMVVDSAFTLLAAIASSLLLSAVVL